MSTDTSYIVFRKVGCSVLTCFWSDSSYWMCSMCSRVDRGVPVDRGPQRWSVGMDHVIITSPSNKGNVSFSTENLRHNKNTLTTTRKLQASNIILKHTNSNKLESNNIQLTCWVFGVHDVTHNNNNIEYKTNLQSTIILLSNDQELKIQYKL